MDVLLLIVTCMWTLINGTAAMAVHSNTVENSWHLMCEMLHKDEFVFDANIGALGCRLNCVVLKGSNHGDKSYYDQTDVFEHNLNDGIYCKRDHICKAGNCTLDYSSSSTQDKKGVVVIEVLDAKLPRKDQVTASDGYVKLSIVGPTGDHKVGRTKILWDLDHPVFNQTFKVEHVSIMSTIFFEVYDRDLVATDDYIGSVYIPIKKMLKDNLNGKVHNLTFPDGSLNACVTWLGDET
ncbi:hypothetical protein HDE_07719 [Halotydeus destructor]|nr:hypothetical protein HDE_07719 [Halotydeus destructor]